MVYNQNGTEVRITTTQLNNNNLSGTSLEQEDLLNDVLAKSGQQNYVQIYSLTYDINNVINDRDNTQTLHYYIGYTRKLNRGGSESGSTYYAEWESLESENTEDNPNLLNDFFKKITLSINTTSANEYNYGEPQITFPDYKVTLWDTNNLTYIQKPIVFGQYYNVIAIK